MPIYSVGQTSGDGFSVAYKLEGPRLLDPAADGAGDIRKAEQAAVRGAGQQALRRARGLYSPPAIKAGWGLSIRTVGLLSISLQNPVPLTAWVDQGTKPHDIIAPLRHVVHWGGPGGDVFATRVHHPGTPGKHRLDALPAFLGAAFEAQVAKRVTPLLQGLPGVVGAE